MSEHVEAERLIPYPVEQVFDCIADHDKWSGWAGFGPVYTEREGVPHRSGVGSVRAFRRVPGLREEVVGFEPSARIAYKMMGGMGPMADHMGEVLFQPEGPTSRG